MRTSGFVYYSININKMIKSKGMGSDMARTGGMKNVYTILVGKLETT
jgi:hypothetical protein